LADRRKLALQRSSVDVEANGLKQITCATAAIARVTSVVGQSRSSISVLTERSISPRLQGKPEADALTRLALAPNDFPDPVQLKGHTFIGGDDLIEGIGDLSDKANLVAGRRAEKSPTRMACKAARSSRSGASGSPRPWLMRLWDRSCHAAYSMGAVGFHFLSPASWNWTMGSGYSAVFCRGDRGRSFGSPLFTSYKNRADRIRCESKSSVFEDFATQRKPAINEFNNE